MLPSLSAARASDLIARFDRLPILVVGDVMLDRFIVGRVTRISPEAPVPVVQFQSEYLRLGGAANVAHNIAALGGRPSLVGIVGADAAARKVREQLAAAGLSVDGFVEDRERPTTEKVRIVTERHQQVARVDYEREADASGDVERAIVEQVTRLGHGARALMVSDYLKGAITRPVIDALLSISRVPGRSSVAIRPIPLLVDPKIPHLDFYAGATLVTPNHHEAEAATHRRIRTDDDAREAGRDFRKRAQCAAALITRGEHGMWVSEERAEGSLPAVGREVADVTGAGDTVAATLALALAAGATLTEAAALANHAAGIVVGKFGPATVSREELLAAFTIAS
ncbi:MAG: bifunctional hydroxymethylpyrimidine kinase/phosphomethylpyrimidine kinase [Acidobacteria bacterium]|nr:bifunctional hydroxymethylpyrimidine kinase/phosphomethylpyrimidine kinase [Acidobacteriota bacterium]